jgi:hypothetical protein
MSPVTLTLSREETNRRFLQAFERDSQGRFISFGSSELLLEALTHRRWQLLKLMTGSGPMSTVRPELFAWASGANRQRICYNLGQQGKMEETIMETIEAIFDGEILRPENPLTLEPNTRVRITVETLEPTTRESRSFLETARSLNLDGQPDWAENIR